MSASRTLRTTEKCPRCGRFGRDFVQAKQVVSHYPEPSPPDYICRSCTDASGDSAASR